MAAMVARPRRRISTGPTAVALDAAGNLYIADTDNNLIRKVDTNGIITSYVGAPAATDKRQLAHPNGLWFDASGALYIADSGNNRVAKFVAPDAEHFRRQPDRGLLRRWRTGDQGAIEQAGGRHDGRRREHLRRRHEQQPDPQDCAGRHHHHHRRQGRRGLQRRWRKRHRRLR